MTYICYHCFKQKQTDGVCPFCGYDGHDAERKYPLALKAGSILNGRYTVGRVLGQGGFGITYIAQDYQTGERVAIKEYLPGEFANRTQNNSIQAFSDDQRENYEYGKEQFLSEARTLAAFNGDEHIVRIHSYFEENNTAYFVMEYVDGYALDQYMAQKGGRLSVEEANQLLLPLMQSLSVVHAKGIIHRDIAPDNIIINSDGIAKLIDFGAARYSTGEKSKSLDVILKHGFAPKEQYLRRGRQGPYTDVYSLAATYYYAITGKVPPESIERMDEDNLIPPSSLRIKISEKAEDVLYKALEVNAADRYQSMADFHRDMVAAAPASAKPSRPATPAKLQDQIQTEEEAREELARLEQRAQELREKAARLEQERKERETREEAARKAREEAERLERERKAREEAERREQERRAEEARRKTERLEQERKAKEEAERKKREQQEQKTREEAERRERQRLEQEAKNQKRAEQKQAKRSSKALPVAILLLAAIAAAAILPGKLRSPQVQEPLEYNVPIVEEAVTPKLQEPVEQTTEENTEPEEPAVPSSVADQTEIAVEEKTEEAELPEREDDDHLDAVSEEQPEPLTTDEEQEPVVEEPSLEPEDGEKLKGTEPAVSSDSNHDEGSYSETAELPVDNTVTEAAEEEPAQEEESIIPEMEPVEASTEEEIPSLDTDVEKYLAALKTVGNTVSLGHYEQDNDPDNGPEPIEWIVLDVQDGKSLLLSKYALDGYSYHDLDANVTWETCALREWLNSAFATAAFKENEEITIASTNIDNSAEQCNQWWAYRTGTVAGGRDTQDKVFLLSYAEVSRYFETRSAAICKPTTYAVKQGIANAHNGSCWWWLRSPGDRQSRAAYVRVDGAHDVNSHPVLDFGAVRPAIWVDNTGLGTPGYTLTFGHYEQDNDLDNGSEPIEWIVLDAKDGKSLLVSRYALAAGPYNETRNNYTTWENCSLRKWLNSKFLNEAFQKEELPMVASSTIDNSKAQGYELWDTTGGNNTYDSVFLLSNAEARLYFESKEQRMCIATEYARQNGAYINQKTGNCYWWLRSPGQFQDRASLVAINGSTGSTDYNDYVDSQTVAIRPVIWADQTKLASLLERRTITGYLSEHASVGNTVLFGHYEQDNNLANGPEPIEWIVIGEEENKRLLISRFALDCKPYHDSKISVPWAYSSLRKWLNGDFLGTAFDQTEKEFIMLSSLINSEKQLHGFGSVSGISTNDQVFILGRSEVTHYFFRNAEERRCLATAFAIQQGALADKTSNYCWWWLRTPDNYWGPVAQVIGKSGTSTDVPVNSTDRAVRPAIWIDLGS